MTSHARSMFPGKSTLILNERPDLFIGQDLSESDHAGTRRAMFDDPEEFAFGAMSPKSVVLKITRSRIQFGASWSFTVSVRSMTGEAGTLAVVQLFTPFNDLGRIRQGTPESPCFGQLICRNSRLHQVPLCCAGIAKRTTTTNNGNTFSFISLFLHSFRKSEHHVPIALSDGFDVIRHAFDGGADHQVSSADLSGHGTSATDPDRHASRLDGGQ